MSVPPEHEYREQTFSAKLWRWTRRALIAGGVGAAVAALALFLVLRHFEQGLPSISDIKASYKPPQVTRVLARDGTLLAEIFTERRTVVPIATLPPQVKLAV